MADGATVMARTADDQDLNAAERVFAIQELCEHILSFVGVWDLVRCRGVNKAVRSCTECSEIQRWLFLMPTDDLLDDIPNFLRPRSIKMWTELSFLRYVMVGSISLFSLQRICCSGALWEDMFLTMFPVTAIQLANGHCPDRTPDQDRGRSKIVRRKAGIRFRDLVQEAQGFVRELEAESWFKSPCSTPCVTFWSLEADKRRKGRKHRKRRAGG